MAFLSVSSGNSNPSLPPLYELEPPAEAAPRRRQWANALYRHRWLALALIAGFVALAAVASYWIRPYYQATAALIIRHPSLHEAQLTPQDYPAPVDPDREMQTELTILGSRTVAMPVIRKLRLEQRDPEIAAALARQRRHLRSQGKHLSAADADATAYAVFQSKLAPVPDKLSSTVHLSYSSHDPALAAAVVNATMQAFLAETLAVRGASGKTAAHWMRRQVEQAAAGLHQDDGAVAAFQRQHAYVPLLATSGGVSGAQSALLARLADANHAWSAAQAENIADAADVAAYGHGISGPLPAGMGDAAIARAVETVGAAQEQLDTLRTTYQPNFPLVVEAQQQLTGARRKLASLRAQAAAGLRQKLADSSEREQHLQSLVAHLNHQAAATSGLEMQFGVLQARAEAQRTLLATLRQKLNEVELEASLPPSNIEVLDAALPPGEPLYPKLGLDLALGLGLGIIVGVGAALAREHFSDTVTAGDAVQLALGPALAPLGMITEQSPPRSGARGLLPAAPGDGGAANGYQKIAANLVTRCGAPPRAILITSANPGEGKTTSVCQLGRALALAGWRTLVVDADWQRPGCHRFFGLANLNGLAAAQTGRKTAPLNVAPHLDLMPLEDDAPPLQVRAIAVLLEQWREHYDYILVDSPPGNASGEAVVLSSLVEGVVLVLRWGRTRMAEAQQLCQELAYAHAPLLGTLFNRTDPAAPAFRPYRRASGQE